MKPMLLIPVDEPFGETLLQNPIGRQDKHMNGTLDECCHDLNNNNAPKMSAERRRDHLHLMRRRKSRARLLTIGEIVKLQHFRKFLHSKGVGPHGLIRKVLDIRRLELLHAYDENGIPAAKDGYR